jgi:hypothetical protein
MLAKQHWILAHIDELPFNNITIKTASCRESIEVIKPILPEPSTVAFHIDDITLDKIARVISWDYDFVLEFVFNNEKHVQPFLDFLHSMAGRPLLNHAPCLRFLICLMGLNPSL